MIGQEIDARTGDELVGVVRALGRHRYVASRLHLVHAFAVDAACRGGADASLEEADAWAAMTLADPDIDAASKDERLFRRATDAELVAVVSAFWRSGERRQIARERLTAHLEAIDALRPGGVPFDEDSEQDVFPILVDAGWELLPLAQLDADRHKGACDAFENRMAFEVARFEEESAVPPLVTLHELPALGATELLDALDDAGAPRAPFVLWSSGHETYLDYILRGVLRAAKIDDR